MARASHDNKPKDILDYWIPIGVVISVIIHIAIIYMVIYVLPSIMPNKDKVPDAIPVQLIGSLEPPAPAAPAAKVNPDLVSPDVVELDATPVIPQPPVNNTQVKEPVATDVIPLGEKDQKNKKDELEKDKTPPPQNVLPKDTPVKPKPKPKPKPNPEAEINKKIKELERKVAAKNADDIINSRVANIAIERGRGQGESSVDSGGASDGYTIENPIMRAYYQEIREIVRSNWLPPAGVIDPNTSANYKMVIMPNGEIKNLKLSKKSINANYDASIHQAIINSKFPPLPPVFENKPVPIEFTFKLNDLQ